MRWKPVGWLALALLALSGCGKEPARPVSIALVGLGLDSAERLRRDALDEFARTTGIRTDVIPTWGSSVEQLGQTLRLLRRHASTPDVYVIDVIWMGTLGEHLLDLTPYLDQDARSHLPELLRNNTVRDRLVSLPFYVNVGMLYYRTDLLARYGYDRPPATWDELESMSARIQKGERAAGNDEFWGYVWQGAAYEGLTCNALEWQSSFGGGRIIDPEGTITVNNPQAAQALREATGWIGRISPPSVISYNESDSLNAFRSGKAAFLRHWSGGLAPARMAGSVIEKRFGIALLPGGPHSRARAMGGFHLAVSRYSAHPREAVRLVLHLTGSQIQLRRALEGGYLPTIPRLYQDRRLLAALPHAAALENAGADTWVARPSTIAGSNYQEVSKAYYQAVHSVLRRRAPAEDALSELEAQLVKLTGLPVGAPGQ
jgi:trehalose/maltose transport system substrate-binding protein